MMMKILLTLPYCVHLVTTHTYTYSTPRLHITALHFTALWHTCTLCTSSCSCSYSPSPHPSSWLALPLVLITQLGTPYLILPFILASAANCLSLSFFVS